MLNFAIKDTHRDRKTHYPGENLFKDFPEHFKIKNFLCLSQGYDINMSLEWYVLIPNVIPRSYHCDVSPLFQNLIEKTQYEFMHFCVYCVENIQNCLTFAVLYFANVLCNASRIAYLSKTFDRRVYWL